MGVVAESTGKVGTGEAADAADHGDDGDTARSSLATEHARGQRPERTHDGPVAHGRKCESEQRGDEAVRETGPGEAERTEQKAAGDVPAAFAGAVAGPADDHGEDGGCEIGPD